MELVESEPTTRPFQCDWASCGKSFSRKSCLQRRYQIHTDAPCPNGIHSRQIREVKLHQCQYLGCGKNFMRSSALTAHIRTHTGEKLHQ
ncbi:hypothetical protein B0T25DRAFT_501119 [Lasiosphaeria hispida]|uniref:C2H2-type domain-containing protein n=1 Tax=Lasiosphaeria hispida TaxID=260671 RepID=A0AAJ0HHJ2_9PEZI|nr:hypothetical protein B0T25DRAFT_501119 [Lasiosphaeria hispida]